MSTFDRKRQSKNAYDGSLWSETIRVINSREYFTFGNEIFNTCLFQRKDVSLIKQKSVTALINNSPFHHVFGDRR